MPKPQTLEICRKHLFDNPKEGEKQLSPQMEQRLIRIRGAFVHWTEFPMKSELEIRLFITDNYVVNKSQSYDDIEIIKVLLGNVKSASKNWHRYRFNYMVDKGFEMAEEKGDVKAYGQILREYGKNNLLGVPDSVNIPWEEIIPQLIEPTEDPTVIGLKYDPNLRENIQKLKDKYIGEIGDAVTAVIIEDIDHEELEDE